MDGITSSFEKRNTTIFNSPIELGLRIIFLLDAFSPDTIDINQLVIYDYLMTHSSDANGPKSIHPALPHRGSQILVKREPIKKALILMQSKELITAIFKPTGIEYQSNELTAKFIQRLESPYAKELAKISQWIKNRFSKMNEKSLNDYVNNNIGNWGSEFLLESLFRGGMNE